MTAHLKRVDETLFCYRMEALRAATVVAQPDVVTCASDWVSFGEG